MITAEFRFIRKGTVISIIQLANIKMLGHPYEEPPFLLLSKRMHHYKPRLKGAP